MKDDYRFKILTLKNLDEILMIEQATQLVPWSRKMLEQSLSGEQLALGLEVGKQLIAYCFASLVPPEAEILAICVKKNDQHQGFGKQLLVQMIQSLKKNAIETIFLEVRVSNVAAIALYKKIGFQTVGLRKNYYATSSNQREDALLFRLDIGMT